MKAGVHLGCRESFRAHGASHDRAVYVVCGIYYQKGLTPENVPKDSRRESHDNIPKVKARDEHVIMKLSWSTGSIWKTIESSRTDLIE
ncbi:hypothetical protein JTE90_014975 [Oedothorax gibbosus]|uniref:Uncharacterized protein n=1 Tax=Oedothorax gibbosus TaxID=931172 RepID=A0AAV6UZ36_9ARAC|nr:hypothetical protein JTE90_014975 [Oedothorax gibbosus]